MSRAHTGMAENDFSMHINLETFLGMLIGFLAGMGAEALGGGVCATFLTSLIVSAICTSTFIIFFD